MNWDEQMVCAVILLAVLVLGPYVVLCVRCLLEKKGHRHVSQRSKRLMKKSKKNQEGIRL